MLSDLQALLKRQTEVARAVADQEQSAWKMLHMISNLTTIIADQEHCILTLQKERAGAECMAAEISVDLRTQYVEIAKLKKRYDSAEEQVATVQLTVAALETELKVKEKILVEKDGTIQGLHQRVAELEQKQLRQEQHKKVQQPQQPLQQQKQDPPSQISSDQQDALSKSSSQKRDEAAKRLAELRSILNRSNEKATSVASSSPARAKTNVRLEGLRAARDSRLREIRGLLQKKPATPTKTTVLPEKSNPNTTHSDSSTSEESISDISSMDSSFGEGEERHRLYDALVRQRENLREMA